MVVRDDLSDGELVRKAREGDNGAFGTLVSRYMRAAYAVSRSVTGGHQDAEDAVQEAFIVALERLEECRSPDRFSGWFLAIVRNRSRNLVRREILRDTEDVPKGAADTGRTPEQVREQTELQERLQSALQRLPQVQREIVLLHDLEGWKHREIAERLELPAGTIRSHLHFARKALRSDRVLSELRLETGETV
ncbi:MAG: sigma-70 family RNA polymerase sigma factor [Gemmatimonadota bacterium]|nr:sigma-70 family RNA polymerase sigma factor [Gemmatimonadota bacterium]